MKLKMTLLLLALLITGMANGSTINENNENVRTDSVVTNSFWDNWYGQFSMSLNLVNPYNRNFKDVFPNGQSFGINIAVGKWFSPELGGRIKVNWGNGIFENNHNSWLTPTSIPGQNHRNGGYLTFCCDILLNLNNMFGDYNADRRWNISLAPRAGGWYDIGKYKGCPMLGLGFINNYRIGKKWSLFADIGYHFIASINDGNSGKGHGSNGYIDINVGVEMDLSNSKYHKKSSKDLHDSDAVLVNTFWSNWFIQAGLSMSLQNPYDTNFSNVFPNGKTFGINASVGKWFTPEAGLRGGLNWQNGIISNKHALYLDSEDGTMQNYKEHGFLFLFADFFFNLHNIIGGYDKSRKWNAIVFPRMGIAQNFSSSYKECPLLGIGTEQTYRLNDRIKLAADVSYQVVTSGFLDGKYHTGYTSMNSNGWLDISVGVQYDLGKNWWDKPGDKPKATQWEGGHNWPRFIVNTGASVVVAFGAKTALKAMVNEERPDHSDNKSFPSGHASMAFAAARSIDKEFRKDCIWIPIAGYAAATAIGVERVVNDHHHWYDVVAGAGVGIGAAELTWWLSDLCFGKGSHVAVGSSGNTVDVVYNF